MKPGSTAAIWSTPSGLGPASRTEEDVAGGIELTVGEVAERAGLGQSTASEHLALLRRGGLVHATRDGKTLRYRVDSTRTSTELDRLKNYLTICCPPSC